MKRRVTIRDVAALAGVSISTVSRVVAGSDLVKESTVQRVQAAIKETGYRPNYSAQSLVKSSTNTIAVLVDRSPSSSLGNSYFVDILDAIATELDSYDKDLLLAFTGKKNEDEQIRKLVESNKIDGVIKLSVIKNDKSLRYLEKTLIPTVIVGNPGKDSLFFVDNDNQKAMYDACSYLIRKGKKRIAFIGGGKEYMVTSDRQAGYEKAMSDNGLFYQEEDFYYTDFSIDGGYEIGEEILEKSYDALACTDDLIAIGILQKAYEQNVKIPAIGFNNSDLGKMFHDSLSTIDIQVKELGKAAVRLLFNQDFLKEKTKNIIVETKLIERW